MLSSWIPARRTLMTVLLLATAPAHAAAQEDAAPAGGSTETPAEPAAEAVPDAAELEGRAQFLLGQEAYEAGRFSEAITHFTRSFELTGKPDLLFNVAISYDRMRADAEALDYYRRYLEARPDITDREGIEARIRILEATIAQSTPTAPPEAEAEPPATGPGIGPWIVGGAGAAVAVVGIVLLAVSAGDVATVENATRWADAESAYDRAPVLSGIGIASLALGLAAVGAGVAWLVLGSGREAEPTVAWGPNGAAIRF